MLQPAGGRSTAWLGHGVGRYWKGVGEACIGEGLEVFSFLFLLYSTGLSKALEPGIG